SASDCSSDRVPLSIRWTMVSSSPSASSKDSGAGPSGTGADAAPAPAGSTAGSPGWRLEDLAIDGNPEPGGAGQSVDFTFVLPGPPVEGEIRDARLWIDLPCPPIRVSFALPERTCPGWPSRGT